MASESVVKLSGFFTILIMTIMLNNSVSGAFITNGYASSEIYSVTGDGNPLVGLDIESDNLYFGHYENIKSYNISGGYVSTVGTITSTVTDTIVVQNGSVTYTGYSYNYDFPPPYATGYFDTGGTYIQQTTIYGLYDAAVNPAGDLYIAAYPDASGTKIYRYNWASGNTTKIADIGGYSGGLAFDSSGNLYYAYQDIMNPAILKFTVQQVAAGNLTKNDGVSVLDISGGYLAFDENDNFYATTGYGRKISKYDLGTGIETVIANADPDWNVDAIGKFAINGDYIYSIYNERDVYGAIEQITIPEPTTIFLLGLSGLWLRRRSV
ncbi:MAG: PEP-CTERM sorting domain-containing protein [Sedimentisphaerales bacterium]|nr:PEP-CTERM sorting domain-containing protein [Sedimentisphaerales bacterium]